MKKVHFLGFAAILVLGACTHYSEDLSALDGEMNAPASTTLASTSSPQDIAPAAGTMGNELPKYLAREYYGMARFENDKAYDYKASKTFTSKAVMAAKGQAPTPSKVSAYDIPSERAGELSAARKELITALKNQNTPGNVQTLARAQARYECWLERAEEAPDESHYSSCKSEFEAAMASLTMPAAGNAATSYDVSFAENSAIIDPSSVDTVKLVAQFLNDPKNESYTASLTGFSEAATNGEFSNSLVTSCVGAVRDALVAKGVPADKLKPLVAPAQIADAGRKVQVTLIAAAGNVTTPYSTTTQTYVPVTPKTVSVTETPAPAMVAPAPAAVIAPVPAQKTN